MDSNKQLCKHFYLPLCSILEFCPRVHIWNITQFSIFFVCALLILAWPGGRATLFNLILRVLCSWGLGIELATVLRDGQGQAQIRGGQQVNPVGLRLGHSAAVFSCNCCYCHHHPDCLRNQSCISLQIWACFSQSRQILGAIGGTLPPTHFWERGVASIWEV